MCCTYYIGMQLTLLLVIKICRFNLSVVEGTTFVKTCSLVASEVTYQCKHGHIGMPMASSNRAQTVVYFTKSVIYV